MPRKLESWVDRFIDYTEPFASPEIFRRWCAISAVAGAVERKLWITSRKRPIYPHLYIILVGPPGVGKTVITSSVWEFWHGLESHYTASTTVTTASLIDELVEADRRVVRPQETPAVTQFNSLKICVNELGVLLTEYNNEFMNTLTDIYDAKPYSRRRHSRDVHHSVPNPQLNILAGTTPGWLSNNIPAGAWDQGFMSRVILIFSAEETTAPLFNGLETDDTLFNALEHDLEEIANAFGNMKATKEAAELLEHFEATKGHPRPDHPKLLHYCTRRTVHLIKLSMISSISRNDSLTIELNHVQEAMNWLFQAEQHMLEMFKALTGDDTSKRFKDIWHAIYRAGLATDNKVHESQVMAIISDHLPFQWSDRALEVMLKTKMLKVVETSRDGRFFTASSAKF